MAAVSASTCSARTRASAPSSAPFPTEIPTLDKLGLPPIVKKLCDYHQGMILVTGSTGSGKSTTLAAMIDLLNTTRKLNIISLEDPIEFVHRSKSSQVIQRELGTHLPTFAEGVRAAMREDPDVILVGEMRDAETISMAMTAAETGHLVLGTLHTTGAVKTIDRIIDALPIEEREQTKSFLSQSLLAVVTQVLVQDRGRPGPQGHLRGHGDDQGHRQADPDRPDAPDSEPGADGSRVRHADAGSGTAGRGPGEGNRSGSRLCRSPTDKTVLQKFVTDTSILPKLEVPGTGQADAWRHRRIPEGGAAASGLRSAFHRRAIRHASACMATSRRCGRSP